MKVLYSKSQKDLDGLKTLKWVDKYYRRNTSTFHTDVNLNVNRNLMKVNHPIIHIFFFFSLIQPKMSF